MVLFATSTSVFVTSRNRKKGDEMHRKYKGKPARGKETKTRDNTLSTYAKLGRAVEFAFGVRGFGVDEHMVI
jgi:hypothetical protein